MRPVFQRAALAAVIAFVPAAASMFLVVCVAAAVAYGRLTPPLLAVAAAAGVAMGLASAARWARRASPEPGCPGPVAVGDVQRTPRSSNVARPFGVSMSARRS